MVNLSKNFSKFKNLYKLVVSNKMNIKIKIGFIISLFLMFVLPFYVFAFNDINSINLPNDEFYKYQWYLSKIKANKAWKMFNSKKRKDVIVAVIDTGVQIDHPDLQKNIWKNTGEIAKNGIDDDNNGYIDDIHGWNFIANSNNPAPSFSGNFTKAGISHGTIIAGIIGAYTNNKIGIAGIAKDIKIMPLKALNDEGGGTAKYVIDAINYAIDNGADIINLSFIGLNHGAELENVIKKAYKNGIILVAAAGNETKNGQGYNLDATPMYPVCYGNGKVNDFVIGVGAVDIFDEKVNFSGYGSCVDIMAPGVSIFGTVPHNVGGNILSNVFDEYYSGFWAGTSVAAPMVTGAVALIESINYGITTKEVVNILFNNTDSITKLNPKFIGKIGHGRLNLEKSVGSALAQLTNKNIGIILAPFSSNISGNKIKILKYNNDIENEFEAYPNFRGGVNVVSGDIDGDGIDEIITGAGSGGGPQVRIFDNHAKLLGQFFAYDKNFRGGVNVAVGNVDVKSRNKLEIITAPGFGGGPHIRIFDNKFNLINQFFAYIPNFHGGVNISSGDVDKDGIDEVITGAGIGGGPHVKYFKLDNSLVKSFYGYDKKFIGGINVSMLKLR